MAGAASSTRPAPFLRSLDLVDRGVLLAESSLSFVIVLVMVLFAVTETVARLFHVNAPQLSLASDALMFGTLWAAFLGASFATRGRKHLAIDAVGRLLPDRARRASVAFACALGAVVAFVLARGIYEALVEQTHRVGETLRQNQSLGLNARVDRSHEFHFVIPAGFVLIGVRLLLHSFHESLAALGGTPIDKPGASTPPPPDPGAAPPKGPAPVDQAGVAEMIVASVALVLIVALTGGTTVFLPALLVAIGAGATFIVPILRRKQKSGSYAPPAPSTDPIVEKLNVAQCAIAFVIVAAIVGAAAFGIGQIPAIPLSIGVAFFVLMALLGAPLFTFLGGLALFLWAHGTEDVPAMSLANSVEDVLGNHFATMSILPTIPIFTLAGYLMSESKTPDRLVRVARAWLGWMPGGLAVVCVLASAFFTVFSGASGITIVAIGGLLLPALLKDGYREKFSMGLVTTGGAIGITFPPCLPLIVYGIVAGLQEAPPGQERLELSSFLIAGVGPGLLVIALLIIACVFVGITQKVPRSSFDMKEARLALWDAKWELLLPFALLGGLVSGVFSPLQAAAFTAFYVLVIEVFIYKDLSLTRDLPRIVPESMVLVGAIFVKLCAATVLTFFFVQAETANKLFETLTCGPPARAYLAQHSDVLGSCREAVDALAHNGQSAGGTIDSPLAFLLALNVFLIVVGMFMDIFSAIVVIVPLIAGIAMHFHINPYHLGVVFLLNLEIGYLMPPMGLNLFIAGFRFGKPVPQLYPVVLPFIALFAVALLATTYVPGFTLVPLEGVKKLRAWLDEGEAGEQPPRDPPPATDTPTVPDAGAGGPPAEGCDVPREDESFEQFEARCNGAAAAAEGAVPTPTEAAIAPDCDVPRAEETFEQFEARCNTATGSGAAPAAQTPTPNTQPPNTQPSNAPPGAAAIAPGCDVPRADETFEQFLVRCPQ